MVAAARLAAGGLIGLNLTAELLQTLACTAVVAAAGLLVALGVRLRPRVLLSLVALLAAAFALVGGSALAGHSGALPALLGRPWPSPCWPPS